MKVKNIEAKTYNIYEVVEKSGKVIKIHSERSIEELQQDLKDGYDVMIFGKQVINTEDIKEIR